MLSLNTIPQDLSFFKGLMVELKLSSEDTLKEAAGTYPFWEQLSRELVA